MSIVLCQIRYCRFTPKYLVNYVYASHTHGYSLMCGKCLRITINWLEEWQQPGHDEVENPNNLAIDNDEHLDGLDIRYSRLKKKDMLWSVESKTAKL